MKHSGLIITGFVLSFLLPIIGLILCIIGLVKLNKEENKEGKGFAIAGIIISSLAIIFWLPLIGSLAYFGVLSPSSFAETNRCIGDSNVFCDGVEVIGDEVTINILVPRNQNIISISSDTCDYVSGTGTYDSGTMAKIVLNCPFTERLNANILIDSELTDQDNRSITSIITLNLFK